MRPLLPGSGSRGLDEDMAGEESAPGNRMSDEQRMRARTMEQVETIDLRSDTVTRPSEAMRTAMAAAPVGDDVYRDDPGVLALEARTAELLGKEDAVYVPTGTMSNQIAVRVHCEPGDLLLIDGNSHIVNNEAGGAAALSGTTVKPLPGLRGVFSPDDILNAMPVLHEYVPPHLSSPRAALSLENTHNAAGGAVWPLERLREVCAAGRRCDLALHLDGARLWHASAASGVSERVFAEPFDTVNVCFSKGLGAPVGSALAGSAPLIARARRFKQQFGGGMRQAGVIAAAALHALEHHRQELGEDVRRARTLAEDLAVRPGLVIDLETVESNIVRFDVTDMPTAVFVRRCREAGVHMLPVGGSAVRAVVHRDISDECIEKACEVIAGVAGSAVSGSAGHQERRN